jgi:ABC-type dipeptide/oligopeptide/nickel transport system ATPase subunit
MTRVLEARNLAKTYDTGGAKVLALRGVDLAIERGEFVAVMGPSGAASRLCSTCSPASIVRPRERSGSTANGSTN